MPSFWNTSVFSSKVFSPLVRVLCLVDKERKPPMGYIYKAMNRAKKTIIRSFNENEEKYKETFKIIDKRREIQFYGPLHVVGYFLNLKFFCHKSEMGLNTDVISDFNKCILRLTRDLQTRKNCKRSEFVHKCSRSIWKWINC